MEAHPGVVTQASKVACFASLPRKLEASKMPRQEKPSSPRWTSRGRLKPEATEQR
ncbi:Protein of unknown function [Pyronema omphalodes CBS 100304]|uniref:Uncharacterized protein n=1 Tax=Pyronema omphalodes (strain CBS 100304) TaxID=1076935 RepID=U4LH33_PYROM|nr:Protein of unknown function [Pyronema omphalodes CBS 100304]